MKHSTNFKKVSLMSYKKLARHAQPATILLKRAQHRALNSAERTHPPHELGNTTLEVGDVLVDVQGGFLVIDAAPEAVVALQADTATLMKALYALGLAQVPVMIEAQQLVVLPGSHVHALEHELGIQTKTLLAAFIPTGNAIAEHDHHHHQHHDHDHHDCCHHGHDGHAHEPSHEHSPKDSHHPK